MPAIAHALMVLTSLTSADIRLPGEPDPVIQKNGTREASYSLDPSLQDKPLIPVIEDFPTSAKLVNQRDPGGKSFPSFSSLSSTAVDDEKREPQVPFRSHVSWGRGDNVAAESARLPLILPSPSTFNSDASYGRALDSPPPAREGVPDPSIPYDYSESTFNDVHPAAYAGLLLPYYSIRNASAFGNTSQSHRKTKPLMFGDRLVPKTRGKEQIKTIVVNSNAHHYQGDRARENYDRFYPNFEEYGDYYDEEDYDYNLPQNLGAPVGAFFGTKEHDESNQRLSSHRDTDYSSTEIGPEKRSKLLQGNVAPESLDYDENVDLWPFGVVLSPPVSPHLKILRLPATSDSGSTQVDENTSQTRSLGSRSNQSDTRPFSPVILPDFPQSHPSDIYPGTLAAAPYYIRPDRDITSLIDIPPAISSEASSGIPKNPLSSPTPVSPFIQSNASTSVSPHDPIEPSTFPSFISVLFPSNTPPPPEVGSTFLPAITTSVSLSTTSDTAESNLFAEVPVSDNSTSLVSSSDSLQFASQTEPSGGKDSHAESVSSTDPNSQIPPKDNLENVKHFQHEGLTPQYSEAPVGISSVDFSLPSDFQLRENLASGEQFRNKERVLIPSPTNFPNENSHSGRGISATSRGESISTPENSIDFTVLNVPDTPENTIIFNMSTSFNFVEHPTVSTSAEDFFERDFTSTISTNENKSYESETPIIPKKTVINNDSTDPENIHSTDTGFKTFEGPVTAYDPEWGLLDGGEGDFPEYNDSFPLFDILPGDNFDTLTNFSSDLFFTDLVDIPFVRLMSNSSGLSSNISLDGFENLFPEESSDSNSVKNLSSSPVDLSLDSPPNLRLHDLVGNTSTGPVNAPLLNSATTGHKNSFIVTEKIFSNDNANFQPNFPTNIQLKDYAYSTDPSDTVNIPSSSPISNLFVSSESHIKALTTTIPTSGSSLSLSNSSNGISSATSSPVPFTSVDDFEFVDSVVTPTYLEPPGSANILLIDPTAEPAYAPSDGHSNLSSTDPVIFQHFYPDGNTPITNVSIHSNNFDGAVFTNAANSYSFIPGNSSTSNLDKSFLSGTESSGFRDREKDESMHGFLHDDYVQNLTDSESISHVTLFPAEDLSIAHSHDTLLLPRASNSPLPSFIPSTEIDGIADPRPTTPSMSFDQFTSRTPKDTFVSPTTFVNTLVLPTTFAPSNRVTHPTTLPTPIPSQVSFTIPSAPNSHVLHDFLVILSNSTHSLILPQQKGEFSILLTGFKNRGNTPVEFVDVKSPSILPIQAELQGRNLDTADHGARQLELAARIEQFKADEYPQRETELPVKAHDHSSYHVSEAFKVLPTNVIVPGLEKDGVSSLQGFTESSLVDSLDYEHPPPQISGKNRNSQQIHYNTSNTIQVLSNISNNNTLLFDLLKQEDATPNVEEVAQKIYEQFSFNDSYIDAIIHGIRRRKQVIFEKDGGGIRNGNSEERKQPSFLSPIYTNEPVRPSTSGSPSKFFIKASVKNSREAVSTLRSFPTTESVPLVPPEPHWPETSKSGVFHSDKSGIVIGHHGGTTNRNTPSFVPISPALTFSPAREDENLPQTGKPERLKQTSSPSVFEQVKGADGGPGRKKGIQEHSLYSFLFGQPRTAITRPSIEDPLATDNQRRFSGDKLDHWIWKGLPHRQRTRSVREWIQVLREIRRNNLLNNAIPKKPLGLQGVSGVHNNANKKTQTRSAQDLQEDFSGGGISGTIINKKPLSNSFSNGLADLDDFIQTNTGSHSEERWIWRRANPTS